GRDAVSPPELARNTPVPDVFHPMPVRILHIFGKKTDLIRHDRLKSWLRKGFHIDVPLQRKPGLDNGPRSLGSPDMIDILLYLHQQPFFLQFPNDILPCLKTILTRVMQSVFIDPTILRQYVDDFQSMTLPDIVVIGIVSRCDLQTSG